MVPAAAAGTRGAAHYRNFDLVVRHPLEFLYDLTRLNAAEGVAESLTCHPPDILRFIGPKVLARASAIRAVKPGFHDVETIDPALSRHRETQGYVGHFQIRSAARYCNKARLVADLYSRQSARDRPLFQSALGAAGRALSPWPDRGRICPPASRRGRNRGTARRRGDRARRPNRRPPGAYWEGRRDQKAFGKPACLRV